MRVIVKPNQNLEANSFLKVASSSNSTPNTSDFQIIMTEMKIGAGDQSINPDSEITILLETDVRPSSKTKKIIDGNTDVVGHARALLEAVVEVQDHESLNVEQPRRRAGTKNYVLPFEKEIGHLENDVAAVFKIDPQINAVKNVILSGVASVYAVGEAFNDTSLINVDDLEKTVKAALLPAFFPSTGYTDTNISADVLGFGSSNPVFDNAIKYIVRETPSLPLNRHQQAVLRLEVPAQSDSGAANLLNSQTMVKLFVNPDGVDGTAFLSVDCDASNNAVRLIRSGPDKSITSDEPIYDYSKDDFDALSPGPYSLHNNSFVTAYHDPANVEGLTKINSNKIDIDNTSNPSLQKRGNKFIINPQFAEINPTLLFVAIKLPTEVFESPLELILNFGNHQELAVPSEFSEARGQTPYQNPLAFELDEVPLDTNHIILTHKTNRSSVINPVSDTQASVTVDVVEGNLNSINEGHERLLKFLATKNSFWYSDTPQRQQQNFDKLSSSIRQAAESSGLLHKVIQQNVKLAAELKSIVKLEATTALDQVKFDFDAESFKAFKYSSNLAGYVSIDELKTQVVGQQIVKELAQRPDPLLHNGKHEEPKDLQNISRLEGLSNLNTTRNISNSQIQFGNTSQSLNIFDSQFTSRLTAMAVDNAVKGSETIEISLDPKSFGKITVLAALDGNNLDIKLMVENQASLSIMRSAEGLLGQISENNGLRLTQYSVDINYGNGSGSNQNSDDRNRREDTKNSMSDIDLRELDDLSVSINENNGLNLIA